MNIAKLMNKMNYNLSRNSRGKSDLGEIQNDLTDLFFKNPNLTDEQIASFENNLFTNPAMFDSKVDYSSLKSVGEHWSKNLEAYKQYVANKSYEGQRMM